MKPEQKSKESAEISKKMELAIQALEKLDFLAYMGYLSELGLYLDNLHLKNSKPTLDINKKEKLLWIENSLKEAVPKKLFLKNSLAFCAFEEAWRDEKLNKPNVPTVENKYERHLAVKAALNRSTRYQIDLGMRALALNVSNKLIPGINQEEAHEYNQQASLAIKSYQTNGQKFLSGLGKSLAILMAVVCGVTTAAAIISATVAVWPLTAVIIIASIISAASVYANWSIFNNAIPRAFNDIFGKDKLFEGWTSFNDEKTGAKTKLSAGKKIALGFSTFIASSVSVVAGALTYSFILGLGNISLFSFLAVGTIGGAFLPPVAIVFSVIFCIAITTLMINAFANLLRTKNLKDIIKKPFQAAANVFDPTDEKNQGKSLHRLKVEKIITYTALGLLTVVGLFGLAAMQFKGGAAFGVFLSKKLYIAPIIATKIAYSVSMTVALLGQVPFTVESVARTVAKIAATFRNIFSPSNQNSIEMATSPSTNKTTEKFNLQKAVKKVTEVSAYLINALGNGALVIHAFREAILSDFAAIACAGNSASAAAASTSSGHPDDETKTKASLAREETLLKIPKEFNVSQNISPTTIGNVQLKTPRTRYYRFFMPNSDNTSDSTSLAMESAVPHTSSLRNV